jgi:LmbE family N-acetylglucosaminyl deacetylase
MNIRRNFPVPFLEGCKSLLCIQPHPDDNEIGAGATIAKLVAKGCKITYLTVTDGSSGSFDWMEDTEKLVMKRKKEVEAAAGVLGVSSFLYLDYKDIGFIDGKALCSNIVTIIRTVKPEFVLTVDPFLPYEVHPDHISVGMASAQACLFSRNLNFPGGNENAPVQGWAVNGIVFHTTSYPNTFINVDETWNLKFESIAQHKSQFDSNTLNGLKYYFDHKAGQYAQRINCLYAEAFKVLSTLHLHMNTDTVKL